jgi:uncharacterized protein
MSLAALAALGVLAAAAPIPPAPTRWVEDRAALLTPDARAALDARLAGYERATGHQVVVWIGTSLGGAALDDWAARTFAAWRVGRKGSDDGVALFLFADDRKTAIEVGYGLEARLPDAIASRILRDVIAPRMHASDRDGAVTAGVDAILTAIEGRPWAPATRPPAVAPAHETSWIELVGGGAILLIVLVLFFVNPRLALWLLATILTGGRRGGGDGGFSGGGGRSGGGGARGGW